MGFLTGRLAALPNLFMRFLSARKDMRLFGVFNISLKGGIYLERHGPLSSTEPRLSESQAVIERGMQTDGYSTDEESRDSKNGFSIIPGTVAEGWSALGAADAWLGSQNGFVIHWPATAGSAPSRRGRTAPAGVSVRGCRTTGLSP